jgi:hypothetical protein
MQTRARSLFYLAVAGMWALISCAPMDAKNALYGQSQTKPPATGGNGRSPARLAAPGAVSQCVAIDENVSFLIERGPDQCISNLTSFGNTSCKGEPDDPPDKEIIDESQFFIGPLTGNFACPEALIVRTGTPCRIYENYSGGTAYKICYHNNNKRPLRECTKHQGICGPPHNPNP